jgi:cytochrome c biogenesis protein CcmG/thiol:disulfide interchange protein DsbE
LTTPPDTGAAGPPDAVPGEPVTAAAGDRPPATAVRAPRRLRALVIGLVLAAALAVFLFVGLGSTSNNSGTGTGGVVPVGSVAPDFTLTSVLGGAPVSLDALGKLRHHPVVLNFFASWCVPCQKETPLLAATARAEQAKGSVLQFVGVDSGDKPANAIPFIHAAGITYPVGQDPDLSVAANLYGLDGYPSTFFIDESGKVVHHQLGPVTRSELDTWIHQLVGSH